VVTPATRLDEAAKCALVSMDSTLKSNLSVGLPLDLLVYRADRFASDDYVCIDEHNPYFQMIRSSWGQKLHEVFESIDDPGVGRRRHRAPAAVAVAPLHADEEDRPPGREDRLSRSASTR
jgi:putative proteasome-type protease